jgi:RimJ/RimL family protein N-acetyltransferase
MLLTDRDAIRVLLQRDPRWCVYALGDLTPRMFAKCQWFAPDLTLVLRDYGTSILFAHGTGSIREALEHVSWPVHLQVQQDALDEVARYAAVTGIKHMQRMCWEHRDRLGPLDAAPQRRLTADDVAALRRLYADGETAGEAPDFFYDSMVTDGVFVGVFEDRELVAVAGTHLVSRDEGVAAIGNVYTRRDRRSRGYSRLAMSAVLNEIRDLRTIGLNVRAGNAAAIRVYASLGFVTHCDFREALATRRP